MKKFFLILLLLVTGGLQRAAFAQSNFRPGILITLSGDSVKGQLDFRSLSRNNRSCTFKAPDGSLEKYSPDQITGYRFAGNEGLFLSKNLPDIGPRFLKCLLLGRLSLYVYLDEQEVENFYLEKDAQLSSFNFQKEIVYSEKDRQYYSRPNNKYLGLLQFLLSDCPQTSRVAVATPPRLNSIIAIIKKYNQCMDPQQQAYEEKQPRPLVFRAGVLAGIGFAGMNVDLATNSSPHNSPVWFVSQPTLQAGMFFNLSGPWRLSTISLQAEAWYSLLKFKDAHPSPGDNKQYATGDFTLALHYLKIPLLLRYTYPRGPLRPFIHLGLSNNFLLREASNRLDVAYHNNTKFYNSNEKFIPALYRYRVGLVAGAGAIFPLRKGRSLLSSELRFEDAGIITQAIAYKSKPRILSLNLGYSF